MNGILPTDYSDYCLVSYHVSSCSQAHFNHIQPKQHKCFDMMLTSLRIEKKRVLSFTIELGTGFTYAECFFVAFVHLAL